MTKQEATQAVSATLIEAQARLLAMRAQRRNAPERTRNSEAVWPVSSCVENHNYVPGEQQVDRFDPDAIGNLPGHLGWGSQRLSQQLRQAFHNQFNKERSPRQSWSAELSNLQPPTPAHQVPGLAADHGPCQLNKGDATWPSPPLKEIKAGSVKLYPDIGLGILRAKMAASGRIWLLLRWIDRKGSGRIEVEQARHLLCEPESAIKVCGWRQLRILLVRGEGVFWNQRNGRLWLQSIPKVAQALNIEKFSGHPVDLPLETLLGGIGQVRAHLYASFHSGRRKANPISRASLTKISQVSPRSQQKYEKLARVCKQKNYAIGSKLANDNVKNQGWRHGSACFKWHDHKGIFNGQNNTRLAWQLPNSYTGPHMQRSRGRQRQFNRELAVLSTKGITGNNQFADELPPKRYFAAATEAVQTLDREQSGVYWRSQHPGCWYYLEAAGLS